MPGIEVVLFDFGGVIAEEGFRGGLHAIALKNSLDPDAFYIDACRIIVDSGYLTGQADETAFWTCLRRMHRLAQTDDQLREEILERCIPRPRMLALAGLLRQQGIRAGIISDQTNWLDELNSRLDFFKHFDPVFNSFHLHASKYDGTLFDAVMDRLCTTPERMLIIDDSAGNIDRARQRGYATILFEDAQDCIRQVAQYFLDIGL